MSRSESTSSSCAAAGSAKLRFARTGTRKANEELCLAGPEWTEGGRVVQGCVVRRHAKQSLALPSRAKQSFALLVLLLGGTAWTGVAAAQTVVKAKTLHTMSPAGTLTDAVVIAEDGKIKFVGPAAGAAIPAGPRVLEAAVVTPGLIDARSAVGLSGLYNQPHDSDQLERSSPMQPELRAIDAYNPREPLIAWVRSFGVTTLHTGHVWGELVSGQTMIVKTVGDTVDAALVRAPAAVAVTLGPWAQKGGAASPGTRGKMMAMLRAELIRAQEYARKADAAEADKKPDRNLRLEALASVLRGDLPLMVTANRAQDIDSALRLADEFKLKLWLDSASESYLMLDAIKKSGFPVIAHPPMFRPWGEMENMSWETPRKLVDAGVLTALQSGYESYVPKTRVVLFEAAIAAANGLKFDEALALITRDAARLLGIAERVGSIEAGKDADLALYDGDPFEYTTHCVGVVINGKVASDAPR